MSKKDKYNINLDIKYKPLKLIDVPAIVKGCDKKWFNQTLTKVNSSVIRLGIVKGEFHWHKHDKDDEFFFVLKGKLLMDLKNRTVVIKPNQGITIPKGVLHRPRAPKKTIMLMAETAAIKPKGD
jgi:mannose-6-phosphate isomerase-like protein (cupin superfamily)